MDNNRQTLLSFGITLKESHDDYTITISDNEIIQITNKGNIIESLHVDTISGIVINQIEPRCFTFYFRNEHLPLEYSTYNIETCTILVYLLQCLIKNKIDISQYISTRIFKEGIIEKQGKMKYALRYAILCGNHLLLFRHNIDQQYGMEYYPLNSIDITYALISRKSNIIYIYTHRHYKIRCLTVQNTIEWIHAFSESVRIGSVYYNKILQTFTYSSKNHFQYKLPLSSLLKETQTQFIDSKSHILITDENKFDQLLNSNIHQSSYISESVTVKSLSSTDHQLDQQETMNSEYITNNRSSQSESSSDDSLYNNENQTDNDHFKSHVQIHNESDMNNEEEIHNLNKNQISSIYNNNVENELQSPIEDSLDSRDLLFYQLHHKTILPPCLPSLSESSNLDNENIPVCKEKFKNHHNTQSSTPIYHTSNSSNYSNEYTSSNLNDQKNNLSHFNHHYPPSINQNQSTYLRKNKEVSMSLPSVYSIISQFNKDHSFINTTFRETLPSEHHYK